MRSTIKLSNALLLVSTIVSFNISAQEAWSLKRCIEYALENNIQIKQNILNTELSKDNLQLSMAGSLPSINGYASHNYNFGRTIDPFTNEFATNQVQSNSFGLSSSVILFNGFQNLNTIRKNQINYQASKYDVDKMRNDISLAIANAYLQILFNEELAGIAANQVIISKQQVERVIKIVKVGSLAQGSLLDMEAQLAGEELLLVNSLNQLELSYLNLVQLLDLPAKENFMIEKPELAFPGETMLASTPGQVYLSALSSQPEIKSAELRVISSQKELSIARGGLSPRLTFNASYGTGYSGLRKEPIGAPVLSGYDTIGITSELDYVLVPNYVLDYKVTSFNDQFRDNLNQSFGFNLTVPIFNGLANKTAISRAKIAMQNAEYELELNKRQLEKTIQQSYADAGAALKNYQATLRSVDALKESFKYTEQRFNVGMLNTFDYNNAKNKLIKSESDMLQAKYEYIFKTKVLDFYQGKPLTF